MSDINAFKRQMADVLARKGLTFPPPVSDSKPYEALGIGDVMGLGQVTGHMFVFEPVVPEVPDGFPGQRWLSRGANRLEDVDVHLSGGCAAVGLSLFSDTGHLQGSIRLTAKDCTTLATQLLTAAVLLETERAEVLKETAAAYEAMEFQHGD